jgi:APA family basic amino acid/polyamine antiporter
VPLLIGFLLAMQAVIFAYDGYYGVVYFAGEVKDPGRDIPRSMFGGVAAIAAIYILVNAAFIHVLTLRGMAGRDLVAADAAGALFGQRAETGIRVLIIISLISSMNAFQLMASRTLYAISESGIFPAGARVNPGGTPTVALGLSTAAMLFFVLSGSFQKVLAVTAFFFVANYTLAFVSMFVLRRREPEAARPFRARGHPWTTGVVLAGSLAFVGGALWMDTQNSLIAVTLLALSYPLFRARNQTT